MARVLTKTKGSSQKKYANCLLFITKEDYECYFRISREGERRISHFLKSFGTITKSVVIRDHFHIVQKPCHRQDFNIEDIHVILTNIAIVLIG